MGKRKICFVITSPIHYSRNFLILEELKKIKTVELHIALGGTVLTSKYTSHSFNIKKILESENYKNIHEAYFNLDGDNPVIKAKTVGLGIVEFASVFNEINPDVVVVRGDRFEVLAATVASVNMNIPVAHIEGGDLSGTLDESIRHAITKLAHIHFATNDPARKRILKMGEKESYIFNFGSPDVEVVKSIIGKNKFSKNDIDFIDSETGSGSVFDPQKDYLMVMYHPVSTELKNISQNTKNLLEAIHELRIQTLWFWPNFDTGSEIISHELRIFKDNVSRHKIRFLRYIPPKQFLVLLNNTKCMIGNSSAGIKECSFLGVPVVNIGSRQNNRLVAENVLNCSNSKEDIMGVIKKQLKNGKYKPSNLYSSNDTSNEIAKVLSEIDLYTQKKFID